MAKRAGIMEDITARVAARVDIDAGQAM